MLCFICSARFLLRFPLLGCIFPPGVMLSFQRLFWLSSGWWVSHCGACGTRVMELELCSAVSEAPQSLCQLFGGLGGRSWGHGERCHPVGRKAREGRSCGDWARNEPVALTGMGELPGLHLLTAVPTSGGYGWK